MKTSSFIINIPKNLSVIYSKKKKFLVISKFAIQKILKLKFQLVLIKSLRVVRVSSILFNNLSIKKNYLFQFLWNTAVTLIKWTIIETEILFYRQLKCIGIGYKILNMDDHWKKLLLFKIGYSHFLYFWNIKHINTFSFKTTNLFVFGNSYQKVTQIASLIKLFKKPDCYKGKGILYATENVFLKSGKKV